MAIEQHNRPVAAVMNNECYMGPPPALMGMASCKCINELKFQRNWDERLIRSRNKTAPEEPLEAAVLCGKSLGVVLAGREKSGQASDPTFVRGKLVDKNGGC